MAGPSWSQIMTIGGIGLAAVVAYEIYVNQGTIQAAIQNALNPINPYQQQGYYCPGGGVPGPTGLCPNGTPAINQSQFNQIASQMGGCSDGSIVNPSTGRCANGTYPMGGYGQGGLGYPQTSVCNDGSYPNPVNGLCANGSYPSSVGTGVNNSLMNPYGAPQYVNPAITGGYGVPGTTTFTDPTTGQMYDPSTGMLLTPGGSYTTPSLASPYNSLFPQLQPLGQNWYQPPPNISSTNVCSDQSTPDANTGLCHDGTHPVPSGLTPQQIAQAPQPITTTISTPNLPSGTLGCADGSTVGSTGLCSNGMAPTTSLPVTTTPNPSGQVPVTATPSGTGTTTVTPTPVTTTPAPTAVPTVTTTTPTPVTTTPAPTVTTTTPQVITATTAPQVITTQGGFRVVRAGMGGQPGRSGYAGFANEGSMISAAAFGYSPRDSNQATVTSYSSVRSKAGNSPITSEIFGRRFYTKTPIYVSGIR